MPSYFCLICHLNHLNLHLMYLIKCIKTISQPSQISFFFVFLLCVFLRDLFKVPTHKEPGRPLKHALMVSKFLQGWTNVNADDVVKLMYEHHDSTPKAASTTTACPGHSQSALCCLPANDWPVFFFFANTCPFAIYGVLNRAGISISYSTVGKLLRRLTQSMQHTVHSVARSWAFLLIYDNS